MEKPRCYSYIRFSSEKQTDGDSLRRQTASSEAYAKRHGLVLDEKLTMRDLGLSGQGKHKKSGALGRFLEEVRAGKIPAGSILLIEDFDRLSREPLLTAQATFTDLLNAGLKIITLRDSQEFTAASINNGGFVSLIAAIAKMQGARDYVEKLTERISGAWKQKTQNASKEIMTTQCPAWLEVVINNEGKKTGFKIKPGYAASIKKIFELSTNGMGRQSIRTWFNTKQSKLKWGDKDKITEQLVAGLLSNTAVYGEYQPKKKNYDYKPMKEAGNDVRQYKRIPDGPSVSNYYPAIITEEVFALARNKAEERTIRDDKGVPKSGGRRSTDMRNLFGPKLFRCAYCFGWIAFRHKNDVSATHKEVMYCKNAATGGDCAVISWPYPEIEKTVINHIRGLDASKFSNNKLETIADDVGIWEGKVEVAKRNIAKYSKLIENDDNPSKTMVERLKEYERSFEEATSQLADAKVKLAVNKHNETERVQSILSEMDKITDKDEKEHFRIKLSNAVKNVISEIFLFPIGLPSNIDEIKTTKGKRHHINQERLLQIHYKHNTHYHEVYPAQINDKNEPREYYQNDEQQKESERRTTIEWSIFDKIPEFVLETGPLFRNDIEAKAFIAKNRKLVKSKPDGWWDDFTAMKWRLSKGNNHIFCMEPDL